MKRLLTFLACCLPLCAFAQGFGSFSHDQPFFAKDRLALGFPDLPDWFLDFDASKGVTTDGGGTVSGAFVASVVEQHQNWPNSVYAANTNNRIRWVQDGANPTNTYFNWTNVTGSGCGITATNDTDLVGTNYTWAFVARVRNTNIVAGQSFLWGSFDAGGVNFNKFSLRVTNQFTPWDFAAYTTTNSFVDQKWFVMTIPVTNGYGYFKINGQTMQISGLPAQNWAWAIGTYLYNGNQHFPGDITRALLWKRCLSSNEVYQVENALLTQYQIAPFTNNFDPATIAGLKVWLKPDAGITDGGDGQSVWRWADQSGNNNHFYNTNGAASTNFAANTPTNLYTTGPRGLKMIRFHGGCLQPTNALSINQPSTYFIVCNRTNVTSPTQFLFDSTDANRNAFFETTQGNLFAGSVAAAPHYNIQAYYSIFTFVFNGASSLIRTNGVASVSSLNPGANSMGKMVLGTSTDFLATWKGDIEELLIYNSAITGSNLTNVETYLRLKYGLLFE